MINIHLDTSFLIRALLEGSAEAERLQSMLRDGDHLSISALCWAEFCCGPIGESTLDVAGALVGEPLPFLARHAGTAASLFNRAGRRRGSLVDCMIAATAIESGATIATCNVADFGRFERAGLKIVS